MKKYELLKDLPGLKAPNLFMYATRIKKYISLVNSPYSFDLETIENNQDWFKEVEEEDSLPKKELINVAPDNLNWLRIFIDKDNVFTKEDMIDFGLDCVWEAGGYGFKVEEIFNEWLKSKK